MSLKSALQNRVGKNYGNFWARLVGTLIRSILHDHLRLFISEQGSGGLTIQSQIQQLNEDCDPSEGEVQPTVSFSKVSRKKMKKPSWCIPSKIKRHHVSTATQKLGKHLWSIRKASKKGSELWSTAAAEEEVCIPSQELSFPVVGEIFWLIPSTMSGAEKDWTRHSSMCRTSFLSLQLPWIW